MNFVFKVYYSVLGIHMHFRLFAGDQDALGITKNFGYCGRFVMREDEGRAYLEVLKRGSGAGGEVQLKAE